MIEIPDEKAVSIMHSPESADVLSRPGCWQGRASTIVVAFTCVAASIAILQTLIGPGLNSIFTQADAGWYANIARGDIANTMQPFTWRELAPLISRVLMFAFHIDVKKAFFWQGVVTLVILLAIVAILLVRRAPKLFFFAAIAGLALWAELFLSLMLPDLLNATLLACLLLLLDQRHYLAASLMLFPMFVSRESTALALLCLIAAGWGSFKLRDYAVAVMASLAGHLTVGWLASGSMSNQEQVSPLLYLVGKIPWNFFKSIGLPLWTNRQPVFCAVPHGVIAVHFQGITSIGFCDYQPVAPVTTLRIALGVFGLLPLLFLFLWRQGLPAVKEESPMLRFCLFYGVASFLLAPLIGAAQERLFGYCWPLFVVYVPSIAMRNPTLRNAAAIIFLVLHFAVTWSNETILPGGHLALEVTLLCLYGGAYLCGWMLLSRQQVAAV